MSTKATSSITIADISDGTDGTGIASTTVKYQAGSSGTTKPTGTWSTSIPSTSASAPYLWTKVTYTYTDGRTPLDVYSVGSTPEGVVVGGRNLLKKYIHVGRNTTKIDDLSIKVGTNDTGDTYFWLMPYVKLIKGNTYTISFDASNVPSGCNWSFGVYTQSSSFRFYINKNGRCSATGVMYADVAAGSDLLIDDFEYKPSTVTNIILSNFKLEEGNKATSYTPAPEDVDSAINSKIASVDVEYYLSTSSSSLSGGSWVTTAPAWVNGKYMWSRTKKVDGAGNITYSPSESGTCIAGATGATGPQGPKGDTGATGATGATGNGIYSIVEQYYQSTSATSLSGGSWSTTYPGWADGKYVWTRSVITYTSGSTTTTSALCVTGSKGDTGATGSTGPQGPKGDKGDSWIMSDAWVDVSSSSYDQNKWYPVTGTILSNFGYNKIKVSVQLDSGTKPSWSIHPNGFSVDFEIDDQRGGWGTTSADKTIHLDNYSFCSASPVSYTQLTNGSIPVLYLRGGGRYHVQTSWACSWTPHTTDYVWSSGSYSQIAPVQSSRPTPPGKSIEAAAKTATNYMNYDSNGLVIGNLTASSLGRNILIDSDSVDIRNGTTVLASYGDNYVYLGKGSVGSRISFCNDKFIMTLNESDFAMTGNAYLNITSQNGIELHSYASSKNYTDIRMSLTSTTIKSMVGDYDSESIFGADQIYFYLQPDVINTKTGIGISSGTITLTAGTAKHGSNLLMSGKLANSYYGMTVNGTDSIWIRTTSQGILPYQSGGSSGGHCYLGTSSWYFQYAYIQTIYGTTIYEGGTSLSSKYAAKSHTHSYLSLTGGTVNGTITADDLRSVGGLSITCAYSSTASVSCHWKDGSGHALVIRGNDGLSSYLGWSGSSSYATVTTIRGRTCKYSNSSGTSTLSDIRLKKDFRDLDVYDKFFDSIEPCAFRMKTGSSGRYHVGYKAQQIEQALLDSGLTTQDFGGFIRSPYIIDKDDPEGIEVHEEAGIKEGEDELGLIYTEFSAMNTYQIQKCKREISELKSEISELKQIISQLRREL